MAKLVQIFVRGKYAYVVFNTLVSLLAFGRNLLFMKTLGLADVGQIAMMQTIVLLISFVQIGTINGAYILFAERESVQTQRIVDIFSIGGGSILVLFALAALLGGGSLLEPLVARETLIIGAFAGLATLFSTWMNNLLIAKGELAQSNAINVTAVSVSLVVALLSSTHGLYAALGAILLQPLIVVLGALWLERDMRPSFDPPDPATLISLLKLGFVPFAAALLTLLSLQIERWTILAVLGQEALGRFYLVMMYMTFFSLIPASLLNIHFPQSMRAMRAGRVEDFRPIRRRHIVEIMLYSAAALVLTVSVLPVLVRVIFPQYESSIPLIFMVFPALFVFVMRDSAALVFYTTKKMKPIVISGIILVSVYAALLGGAVALGMFSLSAVVLLRGIAVTISTAYLFWARHVAIRGLAE